MEQFWHGLSTDKSSSTLSAQQSSAKPAGRSLGQPLLWMVLDSITVLASTTFATLYATHTDPMVGAKGFWHGTLIYGRSMGILLAFVCGFCMTLILSSHWLHLYAPRRLNGTLHEQKLNIQACFTAGLLLTGALYLIKGEDIPRRIVLLTLGTVTISLGARRLVYRSMLYRAFERGQKTRNVLIVGTGPEAKALRNHLVGMRHLGYTFKGFIDFADSDSTLTDTFGDVVGTVDTLFDQTRRRFIDEIFVTNPCERRIVHEVLEQARLHGVDLRVIPDMYEGQALADPIEYIGQFPTIPLHHGYLPEISLVIKRALDIVISSLGVADFGPGARCRRDRYQIRLVRPGLLSFGAHRQKGLRLPLHQVPHHDRGCRQTALRPDAPE